MLAFLSTEGNLFTLGDKVKRNLPLATRGDRLPAGARSYCRQAMHGGAR